jgi:hypothetical protein
MASSDLKLEELEQFLVTLQPISLQEFNEYLFHLLQSKNTTAIEFLNNCLSDTSKKERLLRVAQPFLQEEIRKHISFFFFTINNQFIEQLKLHQDELSANSDELLKNISKIKTKLFLEAFHPAIDTESEAISCFLRVVLKEFVQKKDILFQLLEEAKDILPIGYKIAIKQFISNYRKEL